MSLEEQISRWKLGRKEYVSLNGNDILHPVEDLFFPEFRLRLYGSASLKGDQSTEILLPSGKSKKKTVITQENGDPGILMENDRIYRFDHEICDLNNGVISSFNSVSLSWDNLPITLESIDLLLPEIGFLGEGEIVYFFE